jgi:hypothetical protein
MALKSVWIIFNSSKFVANKKLKTYKSDKAFEESRVQIKKFDYFFNFLNADKTKI